MVDDNANENENVALMMMMEPAASTRIYRGPDCLEDDDPRPCLHCGADPLVIWTNDDDIRCVACNKSHRVCSNCGGLDANTCIHCDTDYCSDCWSSSDHREHCDNVAKDDEFVEILKRSMREVSDLEHADVLTGSDRTLAKRLALVLEAAARDPAVLLRAIQERAAELAVRPLLYIGSVWCSDCEGAIHEGPPCSRCEADLYEGPARLKYMNPIWVEDKP